MLWVEGALARAPSNANLSSAHLSSARSLLKIVECSSFEVRVGVKVFRVEKKGACEVGCAPPIFRNFPAT